MSGQFSSWYVFKKKATLWVVPGICGTLIFLDWFHTYQWKRGQKPTFVNQLLEPEQQTRAL